MILTEKEAAERRCCGPEGCGEAVDNGATADQRITRMCIGSGCMGWRQESDGQQRANVGTSFRKDDGTLEYLSRKTKNAPSDPGWAPLRVHEDEGGEIFAYVRSGTPRGSCGLARSP